jgi:hypothetical protein
MQRIPKLLPKRSALLLLLTLALVLAAVEAGRGADAQPVPVVDGAVGPCSADFTVNDTAGTPVYSAKIKVHIAYGFMYARKLDLEVGTNSDGKARFTGLPERVKRGLFFEASEGDRAAEAFDDPANTCKAQFTVVLRKKP